MYQVYLRLGLCPGPRWGACTTLPRVPSLLASRSQRLGRRDLWSPHYWRRIDAAGRELKRAKTGDRGIIWQRKTDVCAANDGLYAVARSTDYSDAWSWRASDLQPRDAGEMRDEKREIE